MSREAFVELHALIAPDIVCKNPVKAINSSGSYISTITKLAATLRWLAGGSYLDICALFGLSASNFYDTNYVLWPTIIAIDKRIPLGFDFAESALQEAAEEFSHRSHGDKYMNDFVD